MVKTAKKKWLSRIFTRKNKIKRKYSKRKYSKQKHSKRKTSKQQHPKRKHSTRKRKHSTRKRKHSKRTKAGFLCSSVKKDCIGEPLRVDNEAKCRICHPGKDNSRVKMHHCRICHHRICDEHTLKFSKSEIKNLASVLQKLSHPANCAMADASSTATARTAQIDALKKHAVELNKAGEIQKAVGVLRQFRALEAQQQEERALARASISHEIQKCKADKILICSDLECLCVKLSEEEELTGDEINDIMKEKKEEQDIANKKAKLRRVAQDTRAILKDGQQRQAKINADRKESRKKYIAMRKAQLKKKEDAKRRTAEYRARTQA